MAISRKLQKSTFLQRLSKKILSEANIALEKGRVDIAVRHLSRAFDRGIELPTHKLQWLAKQYDDAGQSNKAADANEMLAAVFAKNGFYLKSIAVYKSLQIQRPCNAEFYLLQISELCWKQGLLGNAIATLRDLRQLYLDRGDLESATALEAKVEEYGEEVSRLTKECDSEFSFDFDGSRFDA